MVLFETFLTVATAKVGETLLIDTSTKLNPQALEAFLKQAIKAANKAQPELLAPFQEDGGRGDGQLLNQFFKGRALTELQKPLAGQGKPDAELLRNSFCHTIASHSRLRALSTQQDLILSWMQVFVETYFEAAHAYCEIQMAKEKYYEQLICEFSKVAFSGLRVDGTVVDGPRDFAKIFVLPEVRRQDRNQLVLADEGHPRSQVTGKTHSMGATATSSSLQRKI